MDCKENLIPGENIAAVSDWKTTFEHGDKSGMAIAQSHYNQCAIEPIEVMQMYFNVQEMYGFCKGNALKYVLRSRFKGHELQDMEKALQYTEWAVDVLKGEKIDPRK